MTSSSVVDIGGTPFVHPFSQQSGSIPSSTSLGPPSHPRDRQQSASVSSQGSDSSSSSSSAASTSSPSSMLSASSLTGISQASAVIDEEATDGEELSPEHSWMALYEAGRGYHSSLLAHTAAMWERERGNIERAKLATAHSGRGSRGHRSSKSAGAAIPPPTQLSTRGPSEYLPHPDALRQRGGGSTERASSAKRHRRTYLPGLSGRSRREE